MEKLVLSGAFKVCSFFIHPVLVNSVLKLRKELALQLLFLMLESDSPEFTHGKRQGNITQLAMTTERF